MKMYLKRQIMLYTKVSETESIGCYLQVIRDQLTRVLTYVSWFCHLPCHLMLQNLYPIPLTVLINSGFLGFCSIFLRILLM